jgi:hypothetical protein
MLMCCVGVFSLRRESPGLILGDKPLIFEVVLSHRGVGLDRGSSPCMSGATWHMIEDAGDG